MATLLCVAGLLAGSVAGYILGATYLVERAKHGGLRIEDKYLDFGQVWQQHDFKWTLPIHNPTSAELEIVDFQTSCDCTQASPRAVNIPAGGQANVELSLDLSPKPGEPDVSPRPFSVYVTPMVRGKSLVAAAWEVKGQVQRFFVMNPPAVLLDQPLEYRKPAAAIPVEIHTAEPVRELKAQCDPALAGVAIEKVGTDGRDFRALVTPSAELPLGAVDFHVSVGAIDASGKALPSRKVRVSGVVESDIVVHPSAVVFGALELGTTAEQVITFTSRSGSPLRVERDLARTAQGKHDFAQLQRESSGGKEDDPVQHFRVSLTAALVGDQASELRFATQTDAADEAIPFAIHVSYFGIRPRSSDLRSTPAEQRH